MATIGERLRFARDRKVWTQADLAQESGVPVVTISRIENGYHRSQPYPSTLKKLAGALGVDAGWLRFGSDTRDPPGGA